METRIRFVLTVLLLVVLPLSMLASPALGQKETATPSTEPSASPIQSPSGQTGGPGTADKSKAGPTDDRESGAARDEKQGQAGRAPVGQETSGGSDEQPGQPANGDGRKNVPAVQAQEPSAKDDQKQSISPAPGAENQPAEIRPGEKAVAPGTRTQDQPVRVPNSTSDKPGASLVVAGEEAFRISVKLGAYTPERRVESILRRLQELEKNPAAVDALATRESDFSTDIFAGDLTIMTVTEADANAAGYKSRQELAEVLAKRLKQLVKKDIENHAPKSILIASALTAGATVILLVLLAVMAWIFPRMYLWVAQARGKYIRAIRIQKAELLSQDTLADIVIGLLRVLRIVMVLLLLFIYAPLVLSFFPDTRLLASRIVYSMLDPVETIVWASVVAYLPNLAFVVVTILCTYYLVSFTKFIFKEIERGNIAIDGFDPEWSASTFKIVRFLIICCSFAVIYPYLPGAGSPAFQHVSIFVGVLVSLGSTGSVAHIVAGLFLTYTGAFKLGDRVKIADTVGDVVEKTLLATRIRTIKHEYITIPNGLVLGSHIINYSLSTGNPGLILHTEVTIGYDAPWTVVHKLLINAALKTANVLSEPAPFVLQTSLNDFAVTYQLNAYTNVPGIMAVTYSDLHQNIQDEFNAAGVEIMSPHYSSLRDGNKTTVIAEHLGATYQRPAFHVKVQVDNEQSESSGSKAGHT